MNIPENVQKKMHTVAKKFNEANILMNEIETYLQEQGLEPEIYRNGNGM